MRSVDRVRHGLARTCARSTSAWRALPDFVIVGAQKAGTSSVYYWLSQLPAIVPASRKELHYFDSNFRRGTAWYRSFFPLRSKLREGRITGEASPSYLFYPHATRRIAETVPEARIIVILRNPVRRAISHYHHQVRLAHETRPLREALRADVETERIGPLLERMHADPEFTDDRVRHFSYRARGEYHRQLVELGRHFERENILVLIAEELFDDPGTALSRIARFLGLDVEVRAASMPRRNVGAYPEDTDADVLADLQSYFEEPNRRLVDWLGRSLPWTGGSSSVSNPGVDG